MWVVSRLMHPLPTGPGRGHHCPDNGRVRLVGCRRAIEGDDDGNIEILPGLRDEPMHVFARCVPVSVNIL